MQCRFGVIMPLLLRRVSVGIPVLGYHIWQPPPPGSRHHSCGVNCGDDGGGGMNTNDLVGGREAYTQYWLFHNHTVMLLFPFFYRFQLKIKSTVTHPCRSPLKTWRNNNVVITSKRHHFDVITSKWRRFDVKTTSLSRHVSSRSVQANQWTRDAISASFLRQNDVATMLNWTALLEMNIVWYRPEVGPTFKLTPLNRDKMSTILQKTISFRKCRL